jgi:hypothetical protein
LHDAATYITTLPKKESALSECQNAIEALMLVVRLNGPTIFARIGMMQAFEPRPGPRVYWQRQAFGKAQAQERQMTTVKTVWIYEDKELKVFATAEAAR